MQDQLDAAGEANFHRKNIGVLQHRPWKAKMIVKLNLISFADSPHAVCSLLQLSRPARTAESESQSRFLNDVNEDIDGLQVIGSQQIRSSQVEN